MLPTPFRTKHWTAVRRVGDTYYELDSKRTHPLTIGTSDSDLLRFLATRLNGDGAQTELLLVVTAEVFRTGSWKNDSVTETAETS